MPVVVTGKTWELRDRLRSMGGRWNADSKGWEFHTLSPEHRAEFTAVVGVVIHDKPGAPIPIKQGPRYSHSEVDRLVADAMAGERKKRRTSHRVTNMFGDDPSWFNHFAEQNPTSYFGFSSLTAMIKYVEAISQSIIKDDTDERNTPWERGRTDWTGSECMPDALDIARNGWNEGVELAQEVRERLTGQHAKERRRKYGVAGGSVNVGRLLAGNPVHMLSRPKQPGSKVVTVFSESAFSAGVNSEHVIIRAAIVAAIVDILEMNGFSCEIIAMSMNTYRGEPAWQVVTALKAAGETLDLNDIVFGLGHPSYHRRLSFGLTALDTNLRNSWPSRGTPSVAFTASHTTKANEIYIKQISFGRRADKHAPLFAKVMQIWDLITDGNLPIELNREEIDA